MSLFVFLSVVQAIVALLLVMVILMQKSEGGGLGVGGSPSGFMSARGAADFLTRATTILAAIFVGLSIVLAALAVGTNSTHQIDTSLNRSLPTQSAPDPLAGAGQAGGATGQVSPATQAQPSSGAKPLPSDPLSGAAKQ